jgi:hypothetical protein
MAEENVVLVSFDEESKAYEAASALKQADADGRIGLDAVSVVQRMEDGKLERVMNLGKNRIEMRIPRLARTPSASLFPHSQATPEQVHNSL